MVPAAIGNQRQGFLRRRILSNRFLLYVGLISYSFYIYHVAVGDLMYRWGVGELDEIPLLIRWFVPVFIGTMVVASLSFFLVERPFMNMRLKLGRDPARGKEDYETARRAQQELLSEEAQERRARHHDEPGAAMEPTAPEVRSDPPGSRPPPR